MDPRNLAFNQLYRKDLPRFVKEGLPNHVVNTTSVLAFSNPMMAIYESVGLGISDQESAGIRAASAMIFYGGMGTVCTKGRDLYYKLINKVRSKTHDVLYGAAFGATYIAGLYSLKGRALETIPEEALVGGVISGFLGLGFGYLIDVGRTLTNRPLKGSGDEERLPSWIREASPTGKKLIGLGGIATSLALMFGAYGATPEGFTGVRGMIKGETIEQAIEQPAEEILGQMH